MDLSELNSGFGALHTRPPPSAPAPHDAMRDLVGQVGREVASPLVAALESLNTFATTGRIDRAGLRALRDDIAGARRIGLAAQQISRFAAGRVRQKPAPQDLTQMLRDALAQRARETASRGIDLHQEFDNATALADPSMLSALLQALLEHARSRIEFRIDQTAWPIHARLACRFAFVPPDELPATPPQPSGDVLDTVGWRLLQQLAHTLGVALHREDRNGATKVSIEFAQAPSSGPIRLRSLDAGEAPAGGPNSQPMVGRHVLVISSRRETRNCIRQSLRPLGLMVDYVGSIDEAREFCAGALPHAIVFEAALAGEKFSRLRAEWSADVPTLAFIEISEEARALEISDLGGTRTSRVGRDVLMSALPGALHFELARSA
jgi:hypothetical protein